MINHAANFENAVRDELHKLARAHGIDPSFVGYAVSSTFGPVEVQPGQQALMPGWLVIITLRVELIGVPPAAVPTIIPYDMRVASQTIHLPSEDDFRGAARQAFGVALEARNQLMHPETVPGAVPGLVVK